MANYKTSRYNHFIYLEEEKKYLIYNSISNGLAKMESEIFNRLKKGGMGIAELEKDASNKELIRKLYNGNIIIDNDFDEVEFLRTRFNMSKFSQKTFSLTISCTSDCNLDCAYCYQGVQSSRYPGESLENDILNFTEKRVKSMGYKSLHCTMYGGEPLLNKGFIFSLSKKLMALCKSEDLHYNAMIVTNGTLLNKTIARKLSRFNIRSMQITIDGPKEVHDKRRPFKDGKKSSYETIMKNVEKVLGIIPIQIRINVDKTNFSKTLQLLEEFEKKGWLNKPKDIYFYIGYTRDWTPKCSNILQNCFSMKEFSKVEIEFQEMLISRGYNIGNLYPSLL